MSATTPLAQAGHAWRVAKAQERRKMAALYAVIAIYYDDGMPETQIAKVAGVARMTVRRALGKL